MHAMFVEYNSIKMVTINEKGCVIMIGNDITKISVNTEMSKNQRMSKFISDVENPYSYHCGDAIINVRFTKGDPPLQSKLFSMIQNENHYQ